MLLTSDDDTDLAINTLVLKSEELKPSLLFIFSFAADLPSKEDEEVSY